MLLMEKIGERKIRTVEGLESMDMNLQAKGNETRSTNLSRVVIRVIRVIRVIKVIKVIKVIRVIRVIKVIKVKVPKVLLSTHNYTNRVCKKIRTGHH